MYIFIIYNRNFFFSPEMAQILSISKANRKSGLA